MQLLLTIVICLFAGAGAGLGTGFAGMSAAAVITPMLVTFLHIEPYTAVGIALASDVLASAVSAYTYGRNRNLDIRNGLNGITFFPQKPPYLLTIPIYWEIKLYRLQRLL